MNNPTPPASNPPPRPVPPRPSVVTTPSSTPPISAAGAPPFRLGTPPELGRWLNFLVYGNPGMGKTTLVASAADVEQMRDILFIDAESGDLAVEDNDRIKNPQFITDNRVRVTGFKQISSIHDWLKGHCTARDRNDEAALRAKEAWLRGVKPTDIDKPKRFYTVILDSVTESNAYSIYELLGVNEAKVISGESDDIDVAQWDEFRKNNMRMQMLLRAFRDLPMHFLGTAHAQYVQDEKKALHWTPAVTGQLARQSQGFFDIVGYMHSVLQGEKSEFRLYIRPDQIPGVRYHAKNRRAVFKPTHWVNPTMAQIMKDTGMLRVAAAS